MLPESQFHKRLYRSDTEDVVFFATADGLYMSPVFDKPKKIDDRKDILSLTVSGRKLYAGTKSGEVIFPLKKQLVNKRMGPVHGFVDAEKLHDISERAGGYIVHETKRACSDFQQFWHFHTPSVYWMMGKFVLLSANKVVDASGRNVLYADDIQQVVQVPGGIWTVQNNLLKDSLGENIAELPSDAESIMCNNDNLYYLRGTPGLEQMLLRTHERRPMFPEHTLTCFALTRRKVQRPV